MSDFKFVDSDWKTRAEAERKKVQQKLDEDKGADRRPPPASFMTILSTFATQAMIALGEAELPGQGRMLDLDQAQFAIDSIAVLREKTAGNLADEEAQALDDVLHSLRLRYVAKTKEEGAAKKPAGGA
jgi:hypothetical protein